MSLLQQIRHYKPSALTLTTLMYGVLCFIQLLNLRVPRDASSQLYQQLINGSNYCFDIISHNNERLTNEFVRSAKSNPDREGIGALKCVYVQDRTKSLISLLDSIATAISVSSLSKSQYLDNHLLNRIEDSISQYIDTSVNTLSPYSKEGVLIDINTFIWQHLREDTGWIHNLFIYQSKEEAIALLSVIKLNITHTAYYTINNIIRENTAPCCFCGPWYYAIAIPDNGYTITGDIAKVQMMVAELNKAINPTIKCIGGKVTKVENGVGEVINYNKYAGMQKIYGTASLDLGDSIRTLPWQTQYYVAPKGIYMHIDNANKCYAGIPFNMTIGLEEYSSDKLSLRSKDAVIKKLNDNTYTITAHKGVKSFMVYMDAINNDGSKSTSVAAKHIIVLQPEPEITLGAIRNGVIGKEYIVENPILDARPKNEELDITYNIKQYDISYIKANNKYIEPVTVQGNKLYNTESLQIGDRIFITDIIATDNYGNTHHVPAMSFKITL